jgi:hypothetical protein
VLLVFWLILKIFGRRRQWYQHLGEWKELKELVQKLNQMAAENEEVTEEDEEGGGYAMPMQALRNDHGCDDITPPPSMTPAASDVQNLGTDSDVMPVERPERYRHQRYYSGSSLSGRDDEASFLRPEHHSASSPYR